MAGERTINWGADATDAQYATGDDDANNRFIVAEDLDGGTVLLEYDEVAGEFVYRGPVNMNGNDVTNVGALDATSVSTTDLDIGNADFAETGDFVAVGPNYDGYSRRISTSSTTYDDDATVFNFRTVWSSWLPNGAQSAVYFNCKQSGTSNDDADIRLQNVSDGETIVEQTGVSPDTTLDLGPTDYTPTTTDSTIDIRAEIRSVNGSEVVLEYPIVATGIKF